MLNITITKVMLQTGATLMLISATVMFLLRLAQTEVAFLHSVMVVLSVCGPGWPTQDHTGRFAITPCKFAIHDFIDMSRVHIVNGWASVAWFCDGLPSGQFMSQCICCVMVTANTWAKSPIVLITWTQFLAILQPGWGLHQQIHCSKSLSTYPPPSLINWTSTTLLQITVYPNWVQPSPKCNLPQRLTAVTFVCFIIGITILVKNSCLESDLTFFFSIDFHVQAANSSVFPVCQCRLFQVVLNVFLFCEMSFVLILNASQ